MSTYSDDQTVTLEGTPAKVLVGICIIGIFALLIAEVSTPEALFFYALMVMMMSGVLTLKQTLSGFSNESMITIGALFFVIAAVERSHIVDALARKAFGVKSGPMVGSLRMLSSCFALSSVFNNTPLVAVMIPVVRDWARLKSMALSQLLMPLSFCVLGGGLLTMIGTSTSLNVQGLMKADKGYEFNFFAPGVIGLPCGIATVLYCVLAAPYLLPSHNGLIRELRDKASQMLCEVEVTEESVFKSRKLGDVLGSLGIPLSAVLKIRRPSNEPTQPYRQQLFAAVGLTKERSVSASQVELEMADVRSSSKDGGIEVRRTVSDASYIKKTMQSWGMRESATENSENRDDAGSVAVNINTSYRDILSPDSFETIGEGDVLFIRNATDVLTKLLKSVGNQRNGLKILDSSVTDLPGFGTELAELVLSHQNPFVGKSLAECLKSFNEKYRVSVVSSRMHSGLAQTSLMTQLVGGRTDTGEAKHGSEEGPAEARSRLNSHEEVNQREEDDQDNNSNSADLEETKTDEVMGSNQVLSAGDVVLCLVKEADLGGLYSSNDFYVVSVVGTVPKPISLYGLCPLVIFIIMISIVASGQINMCPASLATAALFLIGGWIKPKEIPELLDIRLLMLIACSISFAKSMESSGLAKDIAALISMAESSNVGYLFMVYIFTLIITSLISNNAAAVLMYPFAVALADELSVSYKPFVMVVLISATAEFMSPIGYQTHLMVWGPGGYTFMDFVKFGVVPTLIYCIGTCLIAPVVYPF